MIANVQGGFSKYADSVLCVSFRDDGSNNVFSSQLAGAVDVLTKGFQTEIHACHFFIQQDAGNREVFLRLLLLLYICPLIYGSQP